MRWIVLWVFLAAGGLAWMSTNNLIPDDETQGVFMAICGGLAGLFTLLVRKAVRG